MELSLIIGASGAFILLVAFTLNEIGKLEQDTWGYSALNLIGALLILTYAVMVHSIPYMILESVWALVAGFDIVRRLAGRAKSR